MAKAKSIQRGERMVDLSALNGNYTIYSTKISIFDKKLLTKTPSFAIMNESVLLGLLQRAVSRVANGSANF